MKVRISFFIFLMVHVSLKCAGQSWQWAKGSSSSANEFSNTTATDQLGNVYVAGYFDSISVNFDSKTIINTSLQNEGFLTKYDGIGNALWAKSIGGISDETITSISIDKWMNIYACGVTDSDTIFVDDTAIFNPGSIIRPFIAKLDSSGELLSFKLFTGLMIEVVINADNENYIYVAGSYEYPSMSIDSISIANQYFGRNVFLACLDTSLNALWLKNFGGTGDDRLISLDADDNNVALCGFFGSTQLDFGTMLLNNTSGYYNLFIAKSDMSGNIQWAKGAGHKNTFGFGSELDENGNIYITGSFTGDSVSFDSLTLYSTWTPFPPHTGEDMIVAKYDPNGNVRWAYNTTGDFYDEGVDISINKNEIYLCGGFNSSTLFLGSLSVTNIFFGGIADVFIAKLDTSGFIHNMTSIKGWGFDLVSSISTDHLGNAFVSGTFNGQSVLFDSFYLYNSDTINTDDIFLAKLSLPTTAKEMAPIADMFEVYPNPTSGKLYIKTNETGAILSVYEIAGKRVGTALLENNIQSIDFNYPSGIYLLEIIIDGKHGTRKLIRH